MSRSGGSGPSPVDPIGSFRDHFAAKDLRITPSDVKFVEHFCIDHDGGAAAPSIEVAFDEKAIRRRAKRSPRATLEREFVAINREADGFAKDLRAARRDVRRLGVELEKAKEAERVTGRLLAEERAVSRELKRALLVLFREGLKVRGGAVECGPEPSIVGLEESES